MKMCKWIAKFFGKFLWAMVALSTLFGGLCAFGIGLKVLDNALALAATSATGVAFAVIPYVFVRAWHEMWKM